MQLLMLFITALCSSVLILTTNNVALAEGGHNVSAMNPQESLEKLIEGNERYVKSEFIHPHQSEYRRSKLKGGQKPFAIIITCADSRVSPEITFDQGLGDLFVIRNAGNVLDDHIIGSVEYAVAHLGTPIIVVMGHQRCGAVTAATQDATDSKHIISIVNSIKPAVEKAKHQQGDLLDNSIRNNVKLVVNDLEKSDPIIASAVNAGKVKVVGAYYSLDTGKVEFMN